MPVSVDLSGLDAVPDRDWQALSRAKVSFGHQSVGYNILDGLIEITRARPNIAITLVDSADPVALERPALVHYKVGSNCHPETKVQAFTKYLLVGAGERAEIAFFKLCYIDITDSTDPQRLFAQYESATAELSRRFPRLRLAHVTTPLATPQSGLKSAIKRALGRPIWGWEHNRRREVYNDLLRTRFASGGTVFDLAAIESTGPDGRRESSFSQGKSCPALVPAYTDDGGHLGPTGRLIVARELLLWLARLTA